MAFRLVHSASRWRRLLWSGSLAAQHPGGAAEFHHRVMAFSDYSRQMLFYNFSVLKYFQYHLYPSLEVAECQDDTHKPASDLKVEDRSGHC